MRAVRKPKKPAGRARFLLGKIATFVEKRGWLPTAPELAQHVGRGSRWTVWRDLRSLSHAGLVQLERRAWMVTLDGFAFLGVPSVTPRLASRPTETTRKKRRAEARARRTVIRRDVFDLIEKPTIRPPWQSGTATDEHSLPIIG